MQQQQQREGLEIECCVMQCNQPCSRFFNRLLPCCPAAPAVASWAITWCTKRPKPCLASTVPPPAVYKSPIVQIVSRSEPTNRPGLCALPFYAIECNTPTHIFYRLVYSHTRTDPTGYLFRQKWWMAFYINFLPPPSSFLLLFLGRLFIFTLFFLCFFLPSSHFFYISEFFFCFMRSTWRCVAARAWSAGIGIEQGSRGGVDVTHYAERRPSGR